MCYIYIYIFKNDTVVACIFRYKYTWHVNMWYVYNMIYSAGFRIICNYVYVCVWWRNKCTAVLVQKGTPSAKWIVAKSLSMYLSLSHWNVLLPYKLYKSVAGKNRPTLDPICRSFLCLACLVCLVFEVAQLWSCTAGTKEERGKWTNCAKWEKAECHHLVLSLSDLVQKFFCHVQSSNVESSMKSFTKNRMQAKHSEAKP